MQPGTDGKSRWPAGLNDANAVFQKDGVFHVMHQCDGGPAGMACGGGHEGPLPRPIPGEQTYWHSWGHVVSVPGPAGFKWRRLPDPLTPLATNYEHGSDCDGTVSFPPGIAPVMTFGPGCGYKYPANTTGTTGMARPVNLSDPLLTEWSKAAPLTFAAGSPPCSYAGPPGRVWPSPGNATRTWNLVCGVGGSPGAITPW